MIDLDTAKVEVVRLTFPADDHPIILVRESQGWVASRGNTSTLANPEAVRELIHEISGIEVSSIVTDQPASWPVFGVGENQGVRVEVLGKGEKLEDFLAGLGTADPEVGKGHYFVRLTQQNEVYRVENNDMSFSSPNFDRYRNSHFFNLTDKGAIQTIVYKKGHKDYLVKNVGNQWVFDQDNLLDSIQVQTYLQALADVSGASFADNFDETRADEFFDRALSFHLKGKKSLTVNCFRDSSWQNRYVLHSEMNPESWFESDSSGIFELFFKRFEQILPPDIKL